MSVYWMEASKDVVNLAQELIAAYHEELLDARIGLLFRSEAPTANGKARLGAASKVSDRWKPLLQQELDFIIWLAWDRWKGMSPQQRRALLDHELCHCRMVKGESKLRGHDVEEFTEIIERHGLWKGDLEEMAAAIQGQLTLPRLFQRGEVVSVTLSPSLTDSMNEVSDEPVLP